MPALPSVDSVRLLDGIGLVLHASQGIGSDECVKTPKQALQCRSHFALIESGRHEGKQGGFLVDRSIGGFQLLTYGHEGGLTRGNQPDDQFHWRRFDSLSHDEIPFDDRIIPVWPANVA